MARRSPPRNVTYFEPVLPRLGRNTIIESTFDVGRRFRCTMRIDCGQLDPSAVVRPDPGDLGLGNVRPHPQGDPGNLRHLRQRRSILTRCHDSSNRSFTFFQLRSLSSAAVLRAASNASVSRLACSFRNRSRPPHNAASTIPARVSAPNGENGAISPKSSQSETPRSG
jgi:hypothetical protein